MPVVEVPGMGDVEFPDNMSDEQIASAIKKNLPPKQQTPPPSLAAKFASAAVRPVIQAVAGIPMMAADAGIDARNIYESAKSAITGKPAEKYPYFSPMFNQALDQYTVAPQGRLNKGAEFVSSALIGSRLPALQIKNLAPSG